MSDEPALLAAIREHPDEDTPRLAFADWLDEHGRAERAEFIRTQCAVPHVPDEDDRRTALEIAERRLLAANAAEWALPRPVFPGSVATPEWHEEKAYWSVFRRGFLEGVEFQQLSAGQLKPGGEFEQLFAAHPIRELRLRDFRPGSLQALAERPELSRVEAIDLNHFDTSARRPPEQVKALTDGVEALLRSPHLTRLRALSWHLAPLDRERADRWLALPVFARLRRLDNWPTDATQATFWNALADGAFPELTGLHVSWGYGYAHAKDEAVARFARSAACRRLTRLYVSLSPSNDTFPWSDVLANAPLQRLEVTTGSGSDVSGLRRAFDSTPASKELRELRVWGIVMTGADVSGWLERGYAATVRDLALETARFEDADFERLAKLPALARLTRLSLGDGCSRPVAMALLGSPHLGGLRHLRPPSAALTGGDILDLAKRAAFRGLRTLRTGAGQKRRETDKPPLVSLGKGEPFPHLHTLWTGFPQSETKPSELAELLNSPKLPNLTVLHSHFGGGKLDAWRKFAPKTRLAWIGGGWWGRRDNNGHVSVYPPNVYLPNHLDDLER